MAKTIPCTQEEIESVIKFFNASKGTAFRSSTDDLVEVVKMVLENKGYTMGELVNEINQSEEKNIRTFLFKLPFNPNKVAVGISSSETPKLSEAITYLSGAMAQMFTEKNSEEICDKILESATSKIDEFIKKEYGTLQRPVEIVLPDKSIKIEGQVHEKFDDVLKFVMNDEPVFLCGAAGTGKNVMCKQIAKTLDLDFYFSNAVTQEYKITGFTDAMGMFHETQFYKAFKNGGLFMLDEMDASIPEVLIILNAAIANRYFDFPAPIGYVEAHPDFRLIAAGNTFGYGASYQYVGRNTLDAASLDRFAVIEVDYSPAIEESCAGGNRELLEFIRDMRKAANKGGVNIIISYRTITRIAKMEPSLGTSTVLKTCLLKNLEPDDIRMITSNMTVSNKYATAVKGMI